MENFSFKNSTRLIFGKDIHQDIGKYTKSYGSKILLHYESDGDLIKKLGIYNTIINSLNENNIEYIELGGVVPNPRLSLVKKGIEICKDEKIDFILAIGGGSVIDSAKAISLGAKYDGDVWDFLTNAGINSKCRTIPSYLDNHLRTVDLYRDSGNGECVYFQGQEQGRSKSQCSLALSS